MKTEYLNVDSRKVHFYEWGKENDTTIILLHGLCNSGAAFMELAEYLMREYHVIAFDGPGHGETEPFLDETDYLFSKLASWYDLVISKLIDKPFILLGHSWGADVALYYTKQYPTKVRGIILLDGGFTFPDFQEEMTYSKVYEGWSDYMGNFSTFDNWDEVKKEYQNYTKRWNSKIEYMVSTLFKKTESIQLKTSRFTVLSIIKAFFTESFIQTYSSIKCPMLLIHAELPNELEASREKGIQLLRQTIKNLTITRMKDTNHLVHWDDPTGVSRVIHTWVTERSL